MAFGTAEQATHLGQVLLNLERGLDLVKLLHLLEGSDQVMHLATRDCRVIRLELLHLRHGGSRQLTPGGDGSNRM